jgi:hypothetical protein
MRLLAAPQRAILGRPGVVAPAATAALAFAAIAGEPLAMLLVARDASGSFAAGGLVVGAYGAAAGILAPARGRALDRRGMGALVPIAAWHLAAIAGLLATAALDGPLVALIALAAAAGTARSPIFGALRTLWEQLVAPDDRPYAYALQATMQQTAYMAGTLAVAALLAVASPTATLAAVTAATFASIAAFAGTEAVRSWRPAAAPAARSALRSSHGLAALAATAGLTTVTIGSLGVALPAFAVERGAAPAAGVLLAMLTAGSIVGGVAYGSRRWPGTLLLRYEALLAIFAGAVALLAAPRGLGVMLAAALVAGLPVAALMTCRFQLIDGVTPAGAVNEAALWVSAAEAAGVAAGQALAGVVVSGPGTAAAFLLASAGALAACALTSATRGRLAHAA